MEHYFDMHGMEWQISLDSLHLSPFFWVNSILPYISLAVIAWWIYLKSWYNTFSKVCYRQNCYIGSTYLVEVHWIQSIHWPLNLARPPNLLDCKLCLISIAGHFPYSLDLFCQGAEWINFAIHMWSTLSNIHQMWFSNEQSHIFIFVAVGFRQRSPSLSNFNKNYNNFNKFAKRTEYNWNYRNCLSMYLVEFPRPGLKLRFHY